MGFALALSRKKKQLEIPYKIFQILQGQWEPDRQQSNNNEGLRKEIITDPQYEADR